MDDERPAGGGPAAGLRTRWSLSPWRVVGVVCVGAFMAQLDASITQLILPALEREFHADVRAVAWVSMAYLLVLAALLPVVGKLADALGRERLYGLGMAVFVGGSALCGMAPDLPWLIASRLVQGVGGALLGANSVALIAASVAAPHRGRALGIQSAAQAVGLCLGPALGGLLLDTLGWRWVFWINVPLGMAGWLGARLLLRPTAERPPRQPFDLRGVLWLTPGLGLLFLALQNSGPAAGVPGLLPGLWAAAILLLAGFMRHERRAVDPLVNLHLAGNPSFAAGAVAGLLSYLILFGVFFVLPFVLVRAYGDTALAAGLQLAVIPVVLALVAPWGGALNDRRGPRLPTVAGMLLITAGLLLLAVSLDGTPGRRALAVVALMLIGGGQGLFIAPNNSSMMAVAGPDQSGAAGGLINLMRTLGMSLGISLGSVLLAGAAGAPVQNPALLSGSRTTWEVLAGAALLAALLSGLRPPGGRRSADSIRGLNTDAA